MYYCQHHVWHRSDWNSTLVVEFSLPWDVACFAYVFLASERLKLGCEFLPRTRVCHCPWSVATLIVINKTLMYILSFLFSPSVRLCSHEQRHILPSLNDCQLVRRRIRARNVSFVYFDYAFTYVLVSTVPLLLALQLSGEGSQGQTVDYDKEDGFMSWSLIAAAMLGGALLSFGNISFQWATAVYGAPLTTVLAMQASLTVILGTSLNYLIEPEMTARPVLLFAGVCIFLLAIWFATQAQCLYLYEQRERALEDCLENTSRVTGATGGVMEYAGIDFHILSFDQEDDSASVRSARDSSADGEVSHNQRWAKKRFMTGTFIALLGGLSFGFFSPAFNIAVNDPFDWGGAYAGANPSLLVFYANLWFSLAFGIASIVGNLALLKFELQEEQDLEEILWTYMTQASWTDRRVALLAGIVCAAGNVLQFHGGQLVGFATADLVQAYPLISTLWDILWFGEFAHVNWCCSRLSVLLMGMYVAYVGGIVLLSVSCIE